MEYKMKDFRNARSVYGNLLKRFNEMAGRIYGDDYKDLETAFSGAENKIGIVEARRGRFDFLMRKILGYLDDIDEILSRYDVPPESRMPERVRERVRKSARVKPNARSWARMDKEIKGKIESGDIEYRERVLQWQAD